MNKAQIKACEEIIKNSVENIQLKIDAYRMHPLLVQVLKEQGRYELDLLSSMPAWAWPYRASFKEERIPLSKSLLREPDDGDTKRFDSDL
jgi:hypothetical protein